MAITRGVRFALVSLADEVNARFVGLALALCVSERAGLQTAACLTLSARRASLSPRTILAELEPGVIPRIRVCGTEVGGAV